MPAVDELAALLDAHLSSGLPEYDEPLQNLSTFDRTELAELLSGQSAKGQPKGYLAARRSVERWERGERKPSARSLDRLRSARRQRDATLTAYRQRGALMRLRFSWYGERKQETRPFNGLQIPRATMRSVVRDWSEDRPTMAAEELLDAFLAAYNVPNPADWRADIEVTGLELRPG